MRKIRFKVNNKFVEFRIYFTQEEMIEAIRQFSGQKYNNIKNNLAAYCETDIELIKRNDFAVIFLYEDYLTYGVIAHESLHAATGYLLYHKNKNLMNFLNPASPTEELLAETLEDIINGFYKRYSLKQS